MLIAPWLASEAYIRGCGLERSLIELVKMRASQINGCAFCIDMHSKDARRTGETEQRLYLLNAWREAPVLHRTGAGGAGLDRELDATFDRRGTGRGV